MRALALVAALVVASCGPGTVPPRLTVPLGTNDWGGYELLVYDDSGMVTGGRALDQQRGMPWLDGVIAVPDQRELHIGWTGGACHHRPTVRLSGSAAALRVVVANPSDQQLLPLSCPAVGVPLATILSLSEPVAQPNVTFEVEY